MTTRRTVLLAGAAAMANARAATAAPVTIAVSAPLPAETAALDYTLARFTQTTGIPVRREVVTDKMMDVMRSRFAARNTPDLFYLDSHEAPQLIQSGVLESLDTVIESPADFYPQFLDAFRGADRRLYGIPKDFSTLALYVNLDLLSKARMSPARLPADLPGLLAFAADLQKRLPPRTAALILEKDLARHLSAIEAYGEPIITPEGYARLAHNRGALDYLEAWVQAHRQGYALSPRDDLGSDSPGAAFGTGRAALMLEGNWVLGSMRRDYADVRFETREMPLVAGRRQTMAFVVGWAVPIYARNKAGGMALARYMTGPGMREWARRSGTLPSRKSLLAEFQGDPVLAAHIRGAAYATIWSRGLGLPVINTNFGNQFLAALNGSISVAEALARIERVSNSEIKRQL